MTVEEVLEALSNAAERQASALAQLEKYGIPVTDVFTSEMRDRFNEEMATFVQSSQDDTIRFKTLLVQSHQQTVASGAKCIGISSEMETLLKRIIHNVQYLEDRTSMPVALSRLIIERDRFGDALVAEQEAREAQSARQSFGLLDKGLLWLGLYFLFRRR
jgi:hypothetical protein